MSEIERRRTFEAVAQLLSGLARACPLLVVLDDLHEAGLHGGAPALRPALGSGRGHCWWWRPCAADGADAVDEQPARGPRSVVSWTLPDDSIRLLAERAGARRTVPTAIASMTRGHTLFVVEALPPWRTACPVAGGRRAELGCRRRCARRSRRGFGAAVRRSRRCCAPRWWSARFRRRPRSASWSGSPPEAVVAARRAGTPRRHRRRGRRRLRVLQRPHPRDPLRHAPRGRCGSSATAVSSRLLAEQPEAAARTRRPPATRASPSSSGSAAADRAVRGVRQPGGGAAPHPGARGRDRHRRRPAEQPRSRSARRTGPSSPSATTPPPRTTSSSRRAARSGPSARRPSKPRPLTERGWAAFHARDLVQAESLAERAIALPDADDRGRHPRGPRAQRSGQSRAGRSRCCGRWPRTPPIRRTEPTR